NRPPAGRIGLEGSGRHVRRRLGAGQKPSTAAVKMLEPNERILFDQLLAERNTAEREFERVKGRYLEKMPAYQDARSRLDLIEGRIAQEQSSLLEAFEARLSAAKESERGLAAALE